MAATPGYPSGTNTYVPSFEASGSLVIGYSRNPSKFPIASYVQYRPVKTNQGFYEVWTSQEAARVFTSLDSEHNWPDGGAAPFGADQLESFLFNPYLCTRKAYPYALGSMSVDQAPWPLLAAQGAVAAQKAMTARTVWTQYVMRTAAWGANTAAVDGAFGPTPILASGENWTNGGVGYGGSGSGGGITYTGSAGPNIKICLNFASVKVNQATIGVVQPKDLALVINPNTATQMAQSTEIQDYLKQSEYALPQLKGNKEGQNSKWGLPDYLYGHEVIIEDTVQITSLPGAATLSSGYALADNDAYLIAREGELEGLEGGPSFSTVQLFFYKDELTVETKYDADNRRYLGRVVTNFQPQVVSPVSGFYFQHVLGA